MAREQKKGLPPWRSFLVGLILAVASWFSTPLVAWYWTLLEYGIVICLVILRPWYWWSKGRNGARGFIGRAERRQERSNGVMSRWEHMRFHSRTAMRITWARRLQPTRDEIQATFTIFGRWEFTTPAAWWLIFREPVDAYARSIGKGEYGQHFIPMNAHRTFIAVARSGKSQEEMFALLNHQGPAIATSTRGEVVRDTRELREDIGPCYVFNAGQIEGFDDVFKYSILSGCKDMNTAQRRARDLMGPIQIGTERAQWQEQAINVLGPLLYLAAHLGVGVDKVQQWCSPASLEDSKALYTKFIKPKMERTPHGKFALGNLLGFYTTPERTQKSVTLSIRGLLAWMDNEATAMMGNSPNADFDPVADLIRTNGTLYLLGSDPSVQPLMRCLVADITYKASKWAEADHNQGRLPVPLLLSLDEATLTCPGPIDRWVLDMGGRGIVMDIFVQNRSDLDQLYGQHGRNAILNNSLVVQVGKGCKDPEVARDFAFLSGSRTELRASMTDKKKITGYSETEVPVLDPNKIMGLTIGKTLIFTDGRVDLIRSRQAEKRKDVKRLRKAHRKAGAYGRKFPRIPMPNFAEPDLDSQLAQDAEERRQRAEEFEREWVA